MYMVGTPANTVTFSSTSIASASPGSNRGISTMDAPTKNPAFITTVCPNEWKSGSAPKITSSFRMWITEVAVTIAFIAMFRCVSTAPLGEPVVPEV